MKFFISILLQRPMSIKSEFRCFFYLYAIEQMTPIADVAIRICFFRTIFNTSLLFKSRSRLCDNFFIQLVEREKKVEWIKTNVGLFYVLIKKSIFLVGYWQIIQFVENKCFDKNIIDAQGHAGYKKSFWIEFAFCIHKIMEKSKKYYYSINVRHYINKFTSMRQEKRFIIV